MGVVSLVLLVGVFAGAVATGGLPLSQDSVSLHPLGALVVATAVVSLIIHLVAGDDQRLRLILCAGFAAKIVGMIARYQVSVRVYGGLYDAGFYHTSASQIAQWINEEGFVPRSDPRVAFRQTQTTNLAYALGLAYSLTGVRLLTGYVLAASMSYVGLLGFVRAGIDAVPSLDRGRYAAFVVFMPTLAYWPSSLGKEAWMVCWLGVGCFGAARASRGDISAMSATALVVGFGAAAWVRPHIAAIAIAALVGALVWPTGLKGRRVQQIILLAAATVGLVVALGAVRGTFARFTAAETGDFTAILEGTTAQTSQGGSEFSAAPVTGPVSFVRALGTVIFRPFPWEAASAVQLLTSLEGAALLGLGVLSRHRLATLPRTFSESAYVRFAVLYSVGFVVAYASIGNFGILARQRAQLFPLLLLVLALSTRSERRKELNGGGSLSLQGGRSESVVEAKTPILTRFGRNLSAQEGGGSIPASKGRGIERCC